MVSNSTSPISKPSSLRWKILRRALLHPRSSNSENQSEICLNQISRKTRFGFNLIPCNSVNTDDLVEENSDCERSSFRDDCFCYTLPVPNGPKLFIHKRVEDCVDLNDFQACNRYGIDNTGLVCQWPSEDVLAYYCLLHVDMFRSKRVIELGSGYGLAGLVIATVTDPLEVVISDGNPQVVDYIQRNIDANSVSFCGTNVTSMMLHWDHYEVPSISGTFDIVIASDCTFFKEFHKGLVQTIRCLLKEEGPSEAILFSPKRGDSLDKFLVEVKDSGLHFTVTEMYDNEIWRRHQIFINGDNSWPNYDKDHCYPLFIRIAR
ncbi:S-adenosyl-L-methionine-dependent methyltransferase superfamily protein [Abeliophyllum distichum]|uniref:Calmodulin-lysine N-methyltransferase n=1 Tax=Abeliophyllum distichum TaxID=126358 RepID=A0ABD1TZE5_9LAMI